MNESSCKLLLGLVWDRDLKLCLTITSAKSILSSFTFFTFIALFPKSKKEHVINKRGEDVFFVKMAKTERYKKSAIISMQKVLNIEASKQKEITKKIINYMPVNYDCIQSLSL